MASETKTAAVKDRKNDEIISQSLCEIAHYFHKPVTLHRVCSVTLFSFNSIQLLLYPGQCCVDPEPNSGTLGAKWEYSLNETLRGIKRYYVPISNVINMLIILLY